MNASIVSFGMNWIADAFARRIGFAVTGGSDAHTRGAIGYGRTWFPRRSATDLKQALLN